MISGGLILADDDNDDLGLILDQRIRRATEIRAAARAYVRECGRRHEVSPGNRHCNTRREWLAEAA